MEVMMKKKMKLSYYKLITENHQAIRELRLEKGWTLVEAARLLGLKSRGLGHLENGRVGLSL
jgi:transcriptional regulator with XRE-family HTH domain